MPRNISRVITSNNRVKNNLKKMSKNSRCRSMGPSLLDLNFDCILKIFSFLEHYDRLRMALVHKSFHSAAEQCLRTDIIDNQPIVIADYVAELSLHGFIEVLSQFGEYFQIGIFHLNGGDLKYNMDFLKKDTIKCVQKLAYVSEEFTGDFWSFQDEDPWTQRNLRKCLQLLRPHLKHLELKDYTIDDDFGKVIGKVVNLEHLVFSGGPVLTGYGLGNLKNLAHLNLCECSQITSKSVIEICKVAKLRYLNIHRCFLLDNEAFEAIAETQTALERFELSAHYYRATNVSTVSHIRSLREISISFYFVPGESYKLLEELRTFRRHDLTDLAIFRNVDTYDSIQYMFSFPNLRKLALGVFRNSNSLGHRAIRDIVEFTLKLEELEVNSCEFDINDDDILWIVGYLKQLRVLRLPRLLIGDESQFFANIVQAVKKRNTCPFVLHVCELDFRSEFLKSKQYKEGCKFVEVSYVYTDFAFKAVIDRRVKKLKNNW